MPSPDDVLHAFRQIKQDFQAPQTVLEAIYLHKSSSYKTPGTTAPVSDPLPAPRPGEDEDAVQTPRHSYNAKSRRGSPLNRSSPLSSTTGDDPSPARASLLRSPHSPSPTRAGSTNVSDTVHALLRSNNVTQIRFVYDPSLLTRLHIDLLELINLNGELPQEVTEVWRTLVHANSMINFVASPRNYEDGQQHPMAEQVTMLARTLMGSPGILNRQGSDRLAALRPEHGTASKAVKCPADEGCYLAPSETYDHVAYLLEAKRIDVANEVMLVLTMVLEEALDHTIPVDANGVITWPDWRDTPVFGSVTIGVLKKVRAMLTQVYGELHSNRTQRVVLMTWDTLRVFQLEAPNRVVVSPSVNRTRSNLDSFPGTYVRSETSDRYIWTAVGTDGPGQREPPGPTILSTIFALTLCPKPKARDDLWLRFDDEPGTGPTPSNVPPTSPPAPAPAASASDHDGSTPSSNPSPPPRTTSVTVADDVHLHLGGLWLEPVGSDLQPREAGPRIYIGDRPPVSTGRDQPSHHLCLGSGSDLDLGRGRLGHVVAADLWGDCSRLTPGGAGDSAGHMEVDGPGPATSDPNPPKIQSDSSTAAVPFPAKVALKICVPSLFADELHPDDDLGYYTYHDARRQVGHEFDMYTGPLSECRGVSVPNFYGLYRSLVPVEAGQTVEVFVMVLERVGDSPFRSDGRYAHDVQVGEVIRIRSLYDDIHSHGVCHVDPLPRHIRYTHPPRSAYGGHEEYVAAAKTWTKDEPFVPLMVLIDFEAAYCPDDENVLKDEWVKVLAMLGRKEEQDGRKARPSLFTNGH